MRISHEKFVISADRLAMRSALVSLCIGGLFGLLGSAAWAVVQFSSVQANMACFPKIGMADLLAKKQQYNLRIVPDTDLARQVYVVAVLDRLASLGIQPSVLNSVTVEMVTQKSHGQACASEAPGDSGGYERVVLVVGCGFGPEDAAKQLAHEIGHVLGHRGFYSKYMGSNAPCHITNYAGSNRNEEFGEVIATYQASPDILKSVCPSQFDWVHRFVFNNGSDPTKTCQGNPNGSDSIGASQRYDEPEKTPFLNNMSMGSQLSGFMPLILALAQQTNQPQPMEGPPPIPYTMPLHVAPVSPLVVRPVNPWLNNPNNSPGAAK